MKSMPLTAYIPTSQHWIKLEFCFKLLYLDLHTIPVVWGWNCCLTDSRKSWTLAQLLGIAVLNKLCRYCLIFGLLFCFHSNRWQFRECRGRPFLQRADRTRPRCGWGLHCIVGSLLKQTARLSSYSKAQFISCHLHFVRFTFSFKAKYSNKLDAQSLKNRILHQI